MPGVVPALLTYLIIYDLASSLYDFNRTNHLMRYLKLQVLKSQQQVGSFLKLKEELARMLLSLTY